MQDLRLIGVQEDGQHLLLAGPDGTHFRLALDEPLRAAARRDRPRLGQLQIEIDGGMRPREVQSLIRAGATAEEVADRAGWTVEKVRRYEGPILAERVHVADQARLVRVRSRGGATGSTVPTLQGRVAQRMRERGVDPESSVWDAWRGVEETLWTVVLTFAAGGRQRQAAWTYDPVLRTVEAGDDEARWLSADEPTSMGPLPTSDAARDERVRRRGRGRRGRVHAARRCGSAGRSRGGAARPHDGDAAADHGRAAFRSAAGGVGRAGSPRGGARRCPSRPSRRWRRPSKRRDPGSGGHSEAPVETPVEAPVEAPRPRSSRSPRRRLSTSWSWPTTLRLPTGAEPEEPDEPELEPAGAETPPLDEPVDQPVDEVDEVADVPVDDVATQAELGPTLGPTRAGGRRGRRRTRARRQEGGQPAQAAAVGPVVGRHHVRRQARLTPPAARADLRPSSGSGVVSHVASSRLFHHHLLRHDSDLTS